MCTHEYAEFVEVGVYHPSELTVPLEDGNVALVIGGTVVEGTLDELKDLYHRIATEIQAARDKS